MADPAFHAVARGAFDGQFWTDHDLFDEAIALVDDVVELLFGAARLEPGTFEGMTTEQVERVLRWTLHLVQVTKQGIVV